MADEATDLVDLIDSLPEPDRYSFQLRKIYTGEVLKEISLLRSDCSTGVEQISVKCVKQVGDFLTGPLTVHYSCFAWHRDDLIRAMKRGEVTMMVMADYLKAFDTVRFKSILTEMHVMGFSKSFLNWMLN